MSQRSRNLVLLVLCAVLVFSAIACVGGDGDLVQGMQDTNQALQDANDDLHDSGWLK